jgi:glycosyltransferase involved in cell wall biosynthesis
LNIHLENINLGSNSGPNSFALKLFKYGSIVGHSFDNDQEADVNLCFIESFKQNHNNPLVQRLDGLYFNTAQNWQQQNSNILRTYQRSDGVIFQSDFNKRLTFEYFGPHKNYSIIHNGADTDLISVTNPLRNEKYDNLWCCASSWRPHKRLNDNIDYFLQHSGEKDALVVAGSVSEKDIRKEDRIFYIGEVNKDRLLSIYKASKYFIHLAWLDHCPNVVVDARASDCQIICSSTGGTKEIAGEDAIVINEEEWDFSPVELYSPPKMDFTKKIKNNFHSNYEMSNVVDKYFNFFNTTMENKT